MRRGDRSLGHADARAAQVCLHGLNIIVMLAPAMLGCIVSLRRPRARTSAGATMAGVRSTRAVALNAFALTVFRVPGCPRRARWRRLLVVARVVPTILAVALPLVRFSTAGPITNSLIIPLRWGVLGAALLLTLFVGQRDRTDNAAQFLYEALVGTICTARLKRRTKVEHVAPSAGIQAERRVARWAVLRVKLLDVLVEAGLVGDMTAGKLEDTLAAKGMLQRLLANGALAPNEGALPAGARAFKLQHTGHRTPGSPVEGGLNAVTVRRRLPRAADTGVPQVALIGLRLLRGLVAVQRMRGTVGALPLNPDGLRILVMECLA